MREGAGMYGKLSENWKELTIKYGKKQLNKMKRNMK